MPRGRGRPTPQQSLAVAKEPFIDALVAACTTARNALDQPAAERDRQVEDAFFRAAAALETFLSEWIMRCLSFDASSFRTTSETRAANWADAELNARYEPRDRLWRNRDAQISVTVELPIHKKHSLDETRALLGAVDDNVSIRGTAELIITARDTLVASYARRPRQLGSARSAILDATIAIRNVIAHRSERATAQMNKQLASKKLPHALRRGSRLVRASGVGYHLQATAGGRPRFETYFEELAEIGHTLAPTRGRKKVICS
jgi:hypothetical protein